MYKLVCNQDKQAGEEEEEKEKEKKRRATGRANRPANKCAEDGMLG
jgi:hypothetical protein